MLYMEKEMSSDSQAKSAAEDSVGGDEWGTRRRAGAERLGDEDRDEKEEEKRRKKWEGARSYD